MLMTPPDSNRQRNIIIMEWYRNNNSMHDQPSYSQHESNSGASTFVLTAAIGRYGEGGAPDAIERAITEALEKHPKAKIFIPEEAFVPNSRLTVEQSTVNSEITDPTFAPASLRNFFWFM
jgi:hypothetical protein